MKKYTLLLAIMAIAFLIGCSNDPVFKKGDGITIPYTSYDTITTTKDSVAVKPFRRCDLTVSPTKKLFDGVFSKTDVKVDTNKHEQFIPDSTLNKFSYHYTDWFAFDHTTGGWLWDETLKIPNWVWLLFWSIFSFILVLWLIRRYRTRKSADEASKKFESSHEAAITTTDENNPNRDTVTITHGNNRQMIVSGKNITRVHIK